MSKKITLSLSEDSIDKAIGELDQYLSELDAKVERLRQRVAERIAWSAAEGFSTSISDDIFTGGDRPYADVTISVEESGDLSIVIADGKDAVFVEFGAGVYYNGSAGSSPHPKGEELGFKIGEYGKLQGRHNTWALPDSTNKNPILTHGTPAAMPMYHGLQDAVAVMVELAKEVFR